MTNEEWDRKVEFLLNQQAKFDADMQRLEASQAKTEAAGIRLQETVFSMSTLMFEGFRITDNKIAEYHRKLAESQAATEQSLAATDLKLSEKIEIMSEKVDNLADLFERHKREDHSDQFGAET
jgi:hypothetical protein